MSVERRTFLIQVGFAVAASLPFNARASGEPLASLRLVVRGGQADGQRDVREGSTLHSGDRLAVLITVWELSHVHVLHIGARGEATLLSSGAEPARAGSLLRLPPGGVDDAYELDEQTGRETIALLVSRQPLDQVAPALDGELRHVTSHGRLPPRSSLAAAIRGSGADSSGPPGEHAAEARADVGAAPRRAAPKPTYTPGVLDLLGPRRGLRDPASGAVLAYASGGGVAFAVQSFEHVRRR
jgi:Domain of unknown function (DUF4384)